MAEQVFRTADDVATDMMAVLEAITSRNITDLNKGSALRTLIDVVAEEHQETDYQVSLAALRVSLRSATGSDLDKIGSDEGLTRKDELGSSGYVRLSKAVPATSDSAVSAPGTIVLSNGRYQYSNTVACRIFTGSTSWVVDDGVYATIDIPFASGGTGEQTNTAPSTVTQVVTAPSDVDTSSNPLAFAGARMEETDEEFRQRIAYERDRRAGSTRFAYKAEAQRMAEVFSSEFYEWAIMPSGSKYVKPAPGEVWGYVYPAFSTSDEFTAGALVSGYVYQTTLTPLTILDRVRNELEDVRAFPSTLKVFHALAVLVNVRVSVVLYKSQRLADTTTAGETVAQRIRGYLLGLKIGESLSLGAIYGLINEVLPYKTATVTFDVTRNRTHSYTDSNVADNISTEHDEIVKPAGSFESFGIVSITTET